MSWGGHVVDLARGEAVADIGRAAAGLSAASDFEGYRSLIYTHDTPQHAREFSLGFTDANGKKYPPQSSCLLFLMAVARRAGKSGLITFRGRHQDVLRVPYASLIGMAGALVQEIGRQNGLFHEPDGDGERPYIELGTALVIGGNDGLPPSQQVYGGLLHGLLVVGKNADGSYDTVEGGQGNGAVIAARHRELHHYRGGWWLRDAGTESAGRALRYLYPMGELPDVQAVGGDG